MAGVSISVELESIQGFSAKQDWVAFHVPRSRITIGKNGKHYLQLDVVEKKQPDQWGNSHFVKEATTREERANKVETPFCGKGKAFGQPAHRQEQQTGDDERW